MRSRTRAPEAIAAVIFGAILWLGQWLVLRQTEITPRIFALINTVVSWNFCLLCPGVVQSKKFGVERWPDPRLNTGLIFLVGGTCSGAATGKALDFYCWRIEQRLIRIEKERVDQETQERERLEREKFEKQKLEQEAIEAEIAERKRIQREAAIEEERLWYEQHGKDYADYADYEEEDEDE